MFEITKVKSTDKKRIGELNVCVYGASGSGKTRFALNGSKNAVVVNLDKGLASIDNGQELTSLDIKGSAEEVCMGVKNAYDHIKENIKDYDLLVFDTYGHYTAGLLTYFKEFADENSWGMEFSEKLFSSHKEWLELPIDKVFIFHEETSMNDKGEEKFVPSVNGGKFKEALPSFYDIVIRFVNDGENSTVGVCGDKNSVGKNRYLSRMPKTDKSLFGTSGEISTFQELRAAIDK